MILYVMAGIGEGSTSLAAFDAALHQAGVGDHNLIILSSIIPPGAEVSVEAWPERGLRWGDRLYVVLAERRETRPGMEAWAGLGWAQQPDGRGIFVEHMGSSQEEVVEAIQATACEMSARRPGEWKPVEYLTTGVPCRDKPVCAVVVAAYPSRAWDGR